MASSDHALAAVVIGGGPAGRAISHRLAHHGVATSLIDPSPDHPWPATYGLWADERPGWLSPQVVAAELPDAPVITGGGVRHGLGRTYAMLSVPALQTALTDERVSVHAGTVDAVEGGEVVLDDGRRLRAAIIIDAAGVQTATSSAPVASQTAYGVVLEADDLKVDTCPLAFMDWRAEHGEDGWPTFLYAVPLGGGRVLLEETSLARRPGLPMPVLKARLHARLARRGVVVPAGVQDEQVWFRVDRPRRAGVGHVVTFGAAAPLIHPATGYSLGAAIGLAEPVAAAIAGALGGRSGPKAALAAATAARRTIWSPGARVVNHMRRRGLETVLALPPAGVLDFFELFFEQPAEHQRAYLSDRDDPLRVGAAMMAMFRAADGPLRRHLLRWGGVPVGQAPPPSGTIRGR